MDYGAIHTRVGQEERLADLMKKYIAFYPEVPKSEDIVITPAYSTLWRNRGGERRSGTEGTVSTS